MRPNLGLPTVSSTEPLILFRSTWKSNPLTRKLIMLSCCTLSTTSIVTPWTIALVSANSGKVPTTAWAGSGENPLSRIAPLTAEVKIDLREVIGTLSSSSSTVELPACKELAEDFGLEMIEKPTATWVIPKRINSGKSSIVGDFIIVNAKLDPMNKVWN